MSETWQYIYLAIKLFVAVGYLALTVVGVVFGCHLLRLLKDRQKDK